MFESLSLPRIVPCTVGVWLSELKDADRANIEAALALPASQVSHASIRRAIIDEASKAFAAETIADHRNGDCRCSKA